jgi:hypothetical protein
VASQTESDAGTPFGFPLLMASRELGVGRPLAAPLDGADAGLLDGGGAATDPLDAGLPEAGAGELDAAVPNIDLDASAPSTGPDASLPDREADASSGQGSNEDAGIGFTPPPVRVAALARLLPETYEDMSYLVVGSGCLGGPGFDLEQGLSLCGPGFASDRASFSAVVTPMSRLIAFDAVGLQVSHAIQALNEVTVRSDPGIVEGAFFTLASGLVTGGIQPFTAQRSLAVAALGEPLSEVLLTLTPYSNGDSLLSVPWTEALARNGITLSDGRSYTLVLIGANPGAGPGSYWNAAAFSAVESDPLAD